MSSVVGQGGQLVHADEVVRTENPATNLIQAKPADSAEHIIQAKLSGQASGELTFAASNEELDKVAQVAKHEAVQVITDKEVNLATIKKLWKQASLFQKYRLTLISRSRKLRK